LHGLEVNGNAEGVVDVLKDGRFPTPDRAIKAKDRHGGTDDHGLI